MRLVVINHLTLDGVMQAPGRPDEDSRGGFAHGGWAEPRSDGVMQEAVGKRMGGGSLLLGRRSYEGMLSSWNEQGGPYKEALNAMPKFVPSRSADTALAWPNSTLLHGDIPAAIAGLKAGGEGNLVTMGSGELIRSLVPTGLVDEYLLMIHPLLLGSGIRMFDGGARAELRLVDEVTSTTGVLVATYEPA
jgi:dihydrofolate reductase